jgi:endonuclease III
LLGRTSPSAGPHRHAVSKQLLMLLCCDDWFQLNKQLVLLGQLHTHARR